MADFYPLLLKAVDGLEKNTSEARRNVYERARTALLAQLRAMEPPLSESEITRERLALEEAIRKVEAECVRRLRPTAQTLAAQEAQEAAKGAQNATPAAAPPAPPPPQQPEDEAQARPAAPAEEPHEPREPQDQAAAAPAADGPRLAPVPTHEPPAPPPRPEGDGREERWRVLRDVNAGVNAGVRAAREALAAIPFPVVGRNGAKPAPSLPNTGSAPRHAPPRPTPALRRPSPRAAARHRVVPPSEAHGHSRVGLFAALASILVIAGLALGAYVQRDRLAELFGAVRSLTPAPAPQEAAPMRPKITDRVLQEGEVRPQTALPQRPTPQPAAPVAQRVVLYEEDPAEPAGKRYVGSAIWRTEQVPAATGTGTELAIRCDVEVPERRLAMTLSIRRNTDQALPASHTVEILFNLPPDFPFGGVNNVPGLLMKQAEQTRGAPISGLAVKVTNGYFLVGLSAVETEMTRNMGLLKERSWLDIPMVYNNGRRAILAIEKGAPGERIFGEAFAAWGQ
jgi:hypothetical protein